MADEHVVACVNRFLCDCARGLNVLNDTCEKRLRKIEEKMERMERNVQFLEKEVETFDEEEEDEASRKRVEEGVQKNYDDDDDDDDDDEKAVTTEEGREKVKPKAPPSPIPPAPPPPPSPHAPLPPFQGSSSENKTKAAINPLHEKYHKMIRMGVPEQAVRNKMSLDGVDDRNVVF